MILVDNKLQVAKLRLAFVVTFATGLFFIFFGLFSNNTGFENLISLIIGIILLLIFSFLLILKPEYIYITIQKNSKLIVRNYTAFPLFRKYKAFEVPINSVHSFEINKSLMGKRRFIRILVKTKNKVGKYPWLSLSAVSINDINKTIESLNKLLPADRRNRSKF
jgi:hypothetical protein